MPHFFLLQADWSEVDLDSGIGGKTQCTQRSHSSVLSVTLGQIVDNLILQKTASHWSRAGLLWDHLFFFVCLVAHHNAKNGPIQRKMESHPRWNPFPDQERGIIGPASLLHGWHWVLFKFNIMIILSVQGYHSRLSKKGKIHQKQYLLQ